MEDNLQVKMVVELVKELFMKSINNQAELSKLIDKYLIPQESEVGVVGVILELIGDFLHILEKIFIINSKVI
jgi:hypothetical protein